MIQLEGLSKTFRTADGSVEMEIQGSPEQIDRVLQAVEAGRYIHIEHISRRQLPLLEGERDFRTDGSHSF